MSPSATSDIPHATAIYLDSGRLYAEGPDLTEVQFAQWGLRKWGIDGQGGFVIVGAVNPRGHWMCSLIWGDAVKIDRFTFILLLMMVVIVGAVIAAIYHPGDEYRQLLSPLMFFAFLLGLEAERIFLRPLTKYVKKNRKAQRQAPPDQPDQPE